MPTVTSPATATIARATSPYVGFLLTQNGVWISHLILPLNPSTLTFSHPARVTATMTVGGAYYDDFGFGIPTIQLQGHTGWFSTTDGEFNGTSPLDGPTAYDHLYNDIYLKYFELEGSSNAPNPAVQLEIHCPYENLNYYIKPITGFTLTRDRTNPMVFQYQVSFTVINEVGAQLFTPALLQAAASGFADKLLQASPAKYEQAVVQQAQAAAPQVPPAPDPTPNQSATYFSYTVQSGDTLWNILQTYYSQANQAMIAAVAQLNGLANASLIYPGQVIKLPRTLQSAQLTAMVGAPAISYPTAGG